MNDLDQPITQVRFGALVGISQSTVSDLVRREILTEGSSGRAWLAAYCEHLREMAAGRGGESAAELVTERARLAREQADRIAMQNAITRSELAPAYLLEEVLARTGARAARILETIPGMLRRRLPQLTADDVAEVARTVAKARNLASSMQLSDAEADPDDERIDDDATDENLSDDDEAASA